MLRVRSVHSLAHSTAVRGSACAARQHSWQPTAAYQEDVDVLVLRRVFGPEVQLAHSVTHSRACSVLALLLTRVLTCWWDEGEFAVVDEGMLGSQPDHRCCVQGSMVL
jgi:hypothetical protein